MTSPEICFEDERYRLTLEGLADADAGRTLAQAEVEAWAQSLDTDKPPALPVIEGQ